jgi:hypothetical protein
MVDDILKRIINKTKMVVEAIEEDDESEDEYEATEEDDDDEIMQFYKN